MRKKATKAFVPLSWPLGYWLGSSLSSMAASSGVHLLFMEAISWWAWMVPGREPEDHEGGMNNNLYY